MAYWGRNAHTRLMCGAAMLALLGSGGVAFAEDAAKFNIAPQPLANALNEFAVQSPWPILYTTTMTGGKMTAGVKDASDPEVALNTLLAGTGLSYRREGDTFLIVGATDPQSGSAAGDGADGTVEALIVTAQKREEDIQDVPIAISAFTQEALERSQIAGGPDLMTQVPNMTFTKTNFSSYSIQIRGIGTQAISATVDPAVAVAFNNTPFVRNRFFEQEFYDLQRVEVLRGPQGTLYGRNATAGVVNLISQRPRFAYEAKLSADVANYSSTRLEGMINLPLVEDKVALRLAGAWTKRDGYVKNEITGAQIDGRDLWSTRLSLHVEPTDGIEANLIWEHFQEDDDRLRSGKQLCDTHTPTHVGALSIENVGGLPNGSGLSGPLSEAQLVFSQGCKASSLYSPDSFKTPNGKSLPYYVPLGVVFLPAALSDPYASRTQSQDLRVIESTVDPDYRAKSDVAEVQLSFDLGAGLTLASETAYSVDTLFSLEDFNRFNTAPGAWNQAGYDALTDNPDDPADFDFIQYRFGVLRDGVFCDPQIGCSDRLVAVDLSTAKSRQFSQELRLSSDYDGPFNFSLGANYLRYDTEDKYYVFINSVSMISAISPYGRNRKLSPYVNGVSDNRECQRNGEEPGTPGYIYGVPYCTYMDTNPIGSLNDQGHNYFLSKNPYKLISYAAFGEAYYNLAENLKVTAGFRWTVDKKEAPRIPSWLLAADSVGYPVAETIRLDWSEPTGRLAIDWKPALSFTDETLVYGSYARGYKAGGANPPGYTYVSYGGGSQPETDPSVTRPKTFDPEFVNAFEVGTKNTLMDGRLTVNLSAFYYDYSGYQISQIVDRSAFNQNFDAEVWGAEIEADWRPLENLRLGFKGGYEKTRLADGTQAIDLMDRTAGDPNWVVLKPFPTYASNCILPALVFAGVYDQESGPQMPGVVLPGGQPGGNPGPCELAYVFNFDPVTAAPYKDLTQEPGSMDGLSVLRYFPDYEGWDPSTAPNNGEGIFKNLSGKELPNAPHFTATVTADYTAPLPADWLMTLHTDLYYQSEAWTRIFNTEGYDKLKAYTNVNVAAIFTNDTAGWKVMAYIKNVFDRDSITGAFLNSDDTGLTTNVFLTEPRIYGLRVSKEWAGGPWWTGANPNHPAGEPYPLTIELVGQVEHNDASYETIAPALVGAFPEALDPRTAQHADLDTGDGRSLRLTWRPQGSPWSVRLGARSGEANSPTTRVHQEYQNDDRSCGVPAGHLFAALCDPQSPKYQPQQFRSSTVWSDNSEASREEHDVVDFGVGRDLGFGKAAGMKSAVSLGLRFARFKSKTEVAMYGIPDWHLVQGHNKYPSIAHEYGAELAARREFEGTGPVLSWDASKRLLGDETVGHVDLDWSIGGGVLFGKQETTLAGYEGAVQLNGLYIDLPRAKVVKTPVDGRRDDEVTVPLADLRLGLSYEIQRFNIGAGYRWERYFDVLDVGYGDARSADRTIDGPYFKLSVGFGG